MLGRALRMFFVQSLKMIAMQLFRKKIFPHFLPSKIEKKSSSGHAECSCDNAAENFLSNFKKFCSKSGNEEKMISFPKNLFVKLFVCTCTMEICQACRNIVGKNTKNNGKNQRRWIYFFWTKVFFSIKNDSLATENAFLTTLAKSPPTNPQICRSESENNEKNLWNFWNEKYFRQNFPMYI